MRFLIHLRISTNIAYIHETDANYPGETKELLTCKSVACYALTCTCICMHTHIHMVHCTLPPSAKFKRNYMYIHVHTSLQTCTDMQVHNHRVYDET